MTAPAYSLFADLRGRPVRVVGGGAPAERKVDALLQAGAVPRVGAPALTARLAMWAAEGRIHWDAGTFQPDWLDEVWLAVAASDEASENQAVAAAAEARRLLVEVADDAPASRLHPANAVAPSPAVPRPQAGSVVLVGAGPGDAGLLTLNALHAMQQAEVILHDRLVSAEVLALARKEALFIEVGKSATGHSVRQQDIHALMLQHARAGRRVVRLKGGDPFVFGRGGEELEFLQQHGIAFEVVPGVTAALACAAYAGIPLTHRDHAQGVRLVTAHCADTLDTLDWQALAQERQTLAVYMGVAALETFRERLIAAGRRPTTPFALVENGSRAGQRVVTGTLDDLPTVARAHQVVSPALLILGEVTTLAQRLHWFGAPPVDSFPSPAPALTRAA